jgi:hypothetical protein
MTGGLVTYTSAAKQLMVEQVRARAHTQIPCYAVPSSHPNSLPGAGIHVASSSV